MSLMCRFKVDKGEFYSKFNEDFDTYFRPEQTDLQVCIEEGLIMNTNTQLQITELGRLFVRKCCFVFDAYLKSQRKNNQFSKTI